MGLLENTIGAMLGHPAGQGSDRPSEGSPYAPLVAALIAMLGAKAMTGWFGDLGGFLGRKGDAQAPNPQATPQSQGGSSLPGGTSQGTAGGLLGGLGGLISHFQNSGAGGGAVNSWVGSGQNQPASPQHITQALGPEMIRELAQRFNMSEAEVAQRLSQDLPQAVDKLTPNGRLPTPDEVSAWR